MAEGFKNLTNLTIFEGNFQGNATKEIGCEAIFCALSNLTKLEELDIGFSKNNITDNGCKNI